MSVRRKLPLTLFMLIMLALAVGGCTLGSTPTAIPTPTSIAILPTDAPTLAPTVAPTVAPTPTPEPTVPAPITAEDAANLAYTGIYTEAVQLTDGTFEGEPFVEGGASRPTVTLLPDFFAQGDLNGDDLADAVTLLVENSGGSGAFIYLAALLNGADGPANAATVLVGDRGNPNSLTIADGTIVLNFLTQGPTDPMCCPTQPLTQTYALEEGVLMLISQDPAAAVPSDGLTGIDWQLQTIRQPDSTEQTPVDSTLYTLTFDAGQMGGKADCNNVSAAYTLTEDGGIVLGPMITTLAMCAPDSLYDAYTQALGQITGYSFEDGMLVLTFGEDGDGTLVFASDRGSALTDTTWQLETIRQADGTEQTPTDPSVYTLAFDTAGQIAVQADCNRGFAPFTSAESGTLTFGPMGMTKAMCAPESLFDAYTQALGQVTGYSIGEGKLTLAFGEKGDGALVFILQ